MSTVLVIGANSTIARAILPHLAMHHQIITAGRKDCDVYCDVTKEVTVPSGVDVVVNFAAAFGGSTDEEAEIAVQTNKLGVLRVCEAAKKAGVEQVVHISSVFALLSPADPGFSIYARTKREGDELAEAYAAEHNLLLVILRPSRIYGDDRSFAAGQPFLYQLIDMASRGEDITLHGTKAARRNYIHVADLAEIVARVIDQKVSGVYACVHPEDVTLTEIAITAQNIYGMGGHRQLQGDKPDTPDDKAVDDVLLYEKIGYRPIISMQTGIERIKQHMEEAA